tara:strand:- start:1349 stop:1747 length:399 start_codon:yes stop_codon:yes gene_type:complete
MIKKNDQPLKGFDDLTFNKHAHCEGIQARLAFGSRNQFEISVVSNVFDGHGLYGNVDMCRDTEQFDYLNGTYEVAMWYDGRNSMLPLSVGDDVLAYQTPTQITKLMHQAHLNDFAWVCLLHNLRDERDKELA